MPLSEKKSAATCGVCDGPLEFFGPRLDYEYHLCTLCGTLQLYPMPDESFLNTAYEDKYSSANQVEEFGDPELFKSVALPYHNDILQVLIEHKPQGLIIDYGAGWGHLVDMLINSGLNCRGVELSATEVAHCKKNQLPVDQGGIELMEVPGIEVSAITMCAVFEHLTNHHKVLQRFSAILPLGGIIVTLHPTAACYTLLGKMLRLGNRQKELPDLHGSFSPPWHTALFSLSAMNILAQKNGFEVIDTRRASQGRIPGLLGVVQRCLESVNWLGHHLFGNSFPLITTHVFVLRKIKDINFRTNPSSNL